MTKTPRIPRLSKAAIKKAVADLPARMAEIERREEDRRCLRGEYAPETGRCVACGGVVEGVVRFHYSDRIGGPPGNAYVPHWACQDCGLMYCKPPPAKPAFDPFENKSKDRP
jgi:uncharacterized protein with PIN domain